MKNNSISLAVTVKNEGDYVRRLLDRLTPLAKIYPDLFEVVVLDDYSDDDKTRDILAQFDSQIRLVQHHLDGDFAAHKNFLNEHCRYPWVLQLDADEMLDEDFLNNLPLYLESNPQVEAYWFPRVNTVDGMTLRHVRDYHWVLTTLEGYTTGKWMDRTSDEYELLKQYNYIINEQDPDPSGQYALVAYQTPIICWPDPQQRLYKNNGRIRWVNRVHERLTGFDHYSQFPMTKDYAIKHDKHISRQERQNQFYDSLLQR